MYALYVDYGFGESEIAWLFIVGFLSSMVVGTFVGGLSDKYGRKLMCMAFCVLYIVAGTNLLLYACVLMPWKFEFQFVLRCSFDIRMTAFDF